MTNSQRSTYPECQTFTEIGATLTFTDREHMIIKQRFSKSGACPPMEDEMRCYRGRVSVHDTALLIQCLLIMIFFIASGGARCIHFPWGDFCKKIIKKNCYDLNSLSCLDKATDFQDP